MHAAWRAAIAAAHARVRLPGSCTALVAVFDQATATLHGANLGDSGLAVFRAGAPLFRTAPQQHFFDCPYQLASVPAGAAAETDTADDAAEFAVGLEAGDVVVAGTDGLWDNAWVEEVGAALPPALPAGGSGSDADADTWSATAAARLVALAATNAADPAYPSPYSAEAAAAGVGRPSENGGGGPAGFLKGLFGGGEGEEPAVAPTPIEGGKLDDVTVVVGVVVA